MYKMKDCPYLEDNCIKDKLDMNNKLECECVKFKAYINAQNKDIINKILKSYNIHSDDKFIIMYNMQKQFCSKLHKIYNLSKDEIDKYTNMYMVCIEDEISEAEEFLDIFENKIKDFDKKEFSKELIDILHFLMDAMIVSGYKYKNNYLEDIENEIENKQFNIIGNTSDLKYLTLLTYLNHDIRLVRQCISWKTWKTPNKTINFKKLHDIYNKMFCDLITIFHFLNININDIYNIYVHKNIENVLRQEYGYNKR